MARKVGNLAADDEVIQWLPMSSSTLLSDGFIWLIPFVFPAMVVYCMLDLILHTTYMERAEK